MREDWENNLRTPALMLLYMDKVREYRLRVVTKEAAADHLRLYPALRLPCVLIRELEVASNATFVTMKSTWSGVLPKLINAMVEEKLIDKPDTEDRDELTIIALQNLVKVKVWYKEKKSKNGQPVELDRKCCVLEMFPEGTPINEVWAKNRDPPRLMGIKKPDGGKVSLFCHVDTSPLFAIEDAVEALCLLLATFHAFNINYTPQAKFPLYLLISATIGPQSVIAKFANNSKFIEYLRLVLMSNWT